MTIEIATQLSKVMTLIIITIFELALYVVTGLEVLFTVALYHFLILHSTVKWPKLSFPKSAAPLILHKDKAKSRAMENYALEL